MPFSLPTPSSAHLGRYRTVIAILLKYGFEDWVAHTRAKRLFSQSDWARHRQFGHGVVHLSRYERVRLALEELGTTFIKFAQVLSSRHDIIPREMIREIERLQDNVPPVRGLDIAGMLEEKLEKPIGELFESWNPVPIASASIAQVYEAWLPNGDHVVLKVRRPGIEVVIAEDLAILKELCVFASGRFPKIAAMHPLDLVESFERSIKKELSMLNEAANIERFGGLFEDDPAIYIPRVYRDLCTDDILCMEFIQGIKVTDLETIERLGYDRSKLAITGVGLYFRQILAHGFFHADPHPGNFFIKGPEQFCLIDFGMMGTLLPRDRELLADFVIQFLEKDTEALINTIQQIAVSVEVEDFVQFEQEIYEFMADWDKTAIKDIKIGELLESFSMTLLENKIRLPGYFFLLIRTFIIIEGVGLKLDPNYNIIQNLAPFAANLVRKRLSPFRYGKRVWGSVQELEGLVRNLPADLRVILQKVKSGKLHVEIEHSGLQETNEAFELGTTRISLAIIIGSLVVGTALVSYAMIPPLVFGIPLLGLAGFLISGLLGIRVVWSIFRKKSK